MERLISRKAVEWAWDVYQVIKSEEKRRSEGSKKVEIKACLIPDIDAEDNLKYNYSLDTSYIDQRRQNLQKKSCQKELYSPKPKRPYQHEVFSSLRSNISVPRITTELSLLSLVQDEKLTNQVKCQDLYDYQTGQQGVSPPWHEISKSSREGAEESCSDYQYSANYGLEDNRSFASSEQY